MTLLERKFYNFYTFSMRSRSFRNEERKKNIYQQIAIPVVVVRFFLYAERRFRLEINFYERKKEKVVCIYSYLDFVANRMHRNICFQNVTQSMLWCTCVCVCVLRSVDGMRLYLATSLFIALVRSSSKCFTCCCSLASHPAS